jgi:large subunit ribosomal protein L13
MTTFMANKATTERKWYVLDAAGVSLGRTAARAAALLRGKHKTTFTPHNDDGDYVVIINASQAVLTGNKLDQKKYRTHSGYPGGLKETSYRVLMETRPELAMRVAVKGMLPKNSIGRVALGRLKVFAGPEHNHQAQKPELLPAE